MIVKTPTGRHEIKWFQYQRFEWIGKRNRPFNRKHLMEKFEISMPQASNDIQKFIQIWPGVLKYDMKKKQYEKVTK